MDPIKPANTGLWPYTFTLKSKGEITDLGKQVKAALENPEATDVFIKAGQVTYPVTEPIDRLTPIGTLEIAHQGKTPRPAQTFYTSSNGIAFEPDRSKRA
jgi:hypothetical protein